MSTLRKLVIATALTGLSATTSFANEPTPSEDTESGLHLKRLETSHCAADGKLIKRDFDIEIETNSKTAPILPDAELKEFNRAIQATFQDYPSSRATSDNGKDDMFELIATFDATLSNKPNWNQKTIRYAVEIDENGCHIQI